jgi:formate C-acetyltransferase
MCIRRAKAFKKLCEEKPIIIQDDELIVGSPGCGPKYVSLCPDQEWHWIEKELDTMTLRNQDPYLITEAQKKELRETILPYWKGKSVYDYCLSHLPKETKRLTFQTGIIDNEVKQCSALGHSVAGWHYTILPKGLKGMMESIYETLENLSYRNPEHHEKIEYLNSMLLCLEGLKILAERHAEEARRMAENENNLDRKKELIKIAEIFDYVPFNPARTFREAAQAIWLGQVGIYMELNGPSLGLGRFDQFMYPYYEKDLKDGIMTKDEALELMECLWMKQAEIIWLLNEDASHFFGGYQLFLSCNMGGLKRDGSDVTNDLTYMSMKATRDLKLHSPSLVARVNKKSPEKYLMEIAKTIRVGIGYPQVHNDEVGVNCMLSLGVPIEDAYDYDVSGCTEIQIQGKMWKYSDAGQFNMGCCVEFALNDGWSRMLPSDERWGLATGNPREFKSYEEIEEAVKKQIAYLTEHLMICNMVTERAHKERFPYPFTSSLMVGPSETGIDFYQGGAIYNVGPSPSYIGLANVANSLAAIKKLIFDEKVITLENLIDALDNNFEDQNGEKIRQLLLNRGPKYGRDDPYVDEIAKRIADFCSKTAYEFTSIRNCRSVSAMYPVAANTPLGMVVGALPSGRKAGMPLADGISPEQGTDGSPTEVIKSVTSWDHSRHPNGTLLNMKFNPSLLKNDNGLRNIVSLVRTFQDLGGWHVQFNVISAETLKDAQNSPEKYPGLMVRVAGYSAYWNDLAKETQDDIISRAEYNTF